MTDTEPRVGWQALLDRVGRFLAAFEGWGWVRVGEVSGLTFMRVMARAGL